MRRRLQVGEKIGDYQILNFLGAGGMGDVYRAVHDKLNRQSAIKVLQGKTDSYAIIKTRFFNEARLQASLLHPNIATLYDFQEIGDELYIFMEFVDGTCLNDLIESRALSVEDSLEIFMSIVEAIAYVHSQGIIHRDIKTQNVKVTPDGTVKLLDFGIAKDEMSQDLTKTGGVIGTPNYLAPEQLKGSPASPATDIWALGVLLYKMLTADVPFNSDTLASLVYQISAAEFQSPEKVNPVVPKSVAQLVNRCLAKDVNHRYQSADELLTDVQKVLRNQYGLVKDSGTRKLISAVDVDRRELEASSFKQKIFIAKVALISAVSVLLLFGIIGIVIRAMSSGSGNTAAANSSNVNQALPNIANDKKATPEKKPSAGAFSDQSKKLVVIIDVTEGKARVLQKGKFLGTTPYELTGNEGEQIELTLEQTGFVDKTVPVEITERKKVNTFSLTAK